MLAWQSGNQTTQAIIGDPKITGTSFSSGFGYGYCCLSAGNSCNITYTSPCDNPNYPEFYLDPAACNSACQYGGQASSFWSPTTNCGGSFPSCDGVCDPGSVCVSNVFAGTCTCQSTTISSVANTCGNNVCEPGEAWNDGDACAEDCQNCGNTAPACNGTCPEGQVCSMLVLGGSSSAPPTCLCVNHPCGDGICAAGEDATLCPADCNAPVTCGAAAYPTCGGECDDGMTCADNGYGSCVCVGNECDPSDSSDVIQTSCTALRGSLPLCSVWTCNENHFCTSENAPNSTLCEQQYPLNQCDIEAFCWDGTCVDDWYDVGAFCDDGDACTDAYCTDTGSCEAVFMDPACTPCANEGEACGTASCCGSLQCNGGICEDFAHSSSAGVSSEAGAVSSEFGADSSDGAVEHPCCIRNALNQYQYDSCNVTQGADCQGEGMTWRNDIAPDAPGLNDCSACGSGQASSNAGTVSSAPTQQCSDFPPDGSPKCTPIPGSPCDDTVVRREPTGFFAQLMSWVLPEQIAEVFWDELEVAPGLNCCCQTTGTSVCTGKKKGQACSTSDECCPEAPYCNPDVFTTNGMGTCDTSVCSKLNESCATGKYCCHDFTCNSEKKCVPAPVSSASSVSAAAQSSSASACVGRYDNCTSNTQCCDQNHICANDPSFTSTVCEDCNEDEDDCKVDADCCGQLKCLNKNASGWGQCKYPNDCTPAGDLCSSYTECCDTAGNKTTVVADHLSCADPDFYDEDSGDSTCTDCIDPLDADDSRAARACTSDSQCCSDFSCIDGKCDACFNEGKSCNGPMQCCGDMQCMNGTCQKCQQIFESCSATEKCCVSEYGFMGGMSGKCGPSYEDPSKNVCNFCSTEQQACTSSDSCCDGFSCQAGKCTKKRPCCEVFDGRIVHSANLTTKEECTGNSWLTTWTWREDVEMTQLPNGTIDLSFCLSGGSSSSSSVTFVSSSSAPATGACCTKDEYNDTYSCYASTADSCSTTVSGSTSFLAPPATCADCAPQKGACCVKGKPLCERTELVTQTTCLAERTADGEPVNAWVGSIPNSQCFNTYCEPQAEPVSCCMYDRNKYFMGDRSDSVTGCTTVKTESACVTIGAGNSTLMGIFRPDIPANQCTKDACDLGKADLAVTKALTAPTGSQPPVAGDTVTFDITIANNGPDAAQNVQVIDSFGNTLEFVSLSGCTDSATNPGTFTQTSCHVGSIPAGGSATVTATFKIKSETQANGGCDLGNRAQASGDTTDDVSHNNMASANGPAGYCKQRCCTMLSVGPYCSGQSQTSCNDEGEYWVAEPTECTTSGTAPTCEPTGLCCRSGIGGTNAVVKKSECTGAGTTFHQNVSLASETSYCTYKRCCTTTGDTKSCVATKPSDCTDANEIWMSDPATCASTCVANKGLCCVPKSPGTETDKYGCSYDTKTACDGKNGVWSSQMLECSATKDSCENSICCIPPAADSGGKMTCSTNPTECTGNAQIVPGIKECSTTVCDAYGTCCETNAFVKKVDCKKPDGTPGTWHAGKTPAQNSCNKKQCCITSTDLDGDKSFACTNTPQTECTGTEKQWYTTESECGNKCKPDPGVCCIRLATGQTGCHQDGKMSAVECTQTIGDNYPNNTSPKIEFAVFNKDFQTCSDQALTACKATFVSCCLDTGCSVLPEEQCAQQGKAFGNALECSSKCAKVACCKEGACAPNELVPRYKCDESGGTVVMTDKASCEADMCKPPEEKGICCKKDAKACFKPGLVTKGECEPGGVWKAGAAECADALCDEPTGVCCVASEHKPDIKNATACATANGVWKAGETDGGLCANTYEACCEDGKCSTVLKGACNGKEAATIAACEALDECKPKSTGVCCKPDGGHSTDKLVEESDCANPNVWMAGATQLNVCDVACCFQDDVCERSPNKEACLNTPPKGRSFVLGKADVCDAQTSAEILKFCKQEQVSTCAAGCTKTSDETCGSVFACNPFAAALTAGGLCTYTAFEDGSNEGCCCPVSGASSSAGGPGGSGGDGGDSSNSAAAVSSPASSSLSNQIYACQSGTCTAVASCPTNPAPTFGCFTGDPLCSGKCKPASSASSKAPSSSSKGQESSSKSAESSSTSPESSSSASSVAPKLTLTKSVGAATVVQGGYLNFAIGVKNTGTADAAGFTFSDTLPASMQLFAFSDDSAAVTCVKQGDSGLSCSGTLPKEQGVTVLLTAAVGTQCGAFTNTATAQATNVPSVSGSANFTVTCPASSSSSKASEPSSSASSKPASSSTSSSVSSSLPASSSSSTSSLKVDLEVKKAGPTSLKAGEAAVYTITITNKGTAPYTSDVQFTEEWTFPRGLLKSVGPAELVTCTGTPANLKMEQWKSAVCTIKYTQAAPLAPGASVDVTVTLAVPVAKENPNFEPEMVTLEDSDLTAQLLAAKTLPAIETAEQYYKRVGEKIPENEEADMGYCCLPGYLGVPGCELDGWKRGICLKDYASWNLQKKKVGPLRGAVWFRNNNACMQGCATVYRELAESDGKGSGGGGDSGGGGSPGGDAGEASSSSALSSSSLSLSSTSSRSSASSAAAVAMWNTMAASLLVAESAGPMPQTSDVCGESFRNSVTVNVSDENASNNSAEVTGSITCGGGGGGSSAPAQSSSRRAIGLVSVNPSAPRLLGITETEFDPKLINAPIPQGPIGNLVDAKKGKESVFTAPSVPDRIFAPLPPKP